jgi:hypothetical protein
MEKPELADCTAVSGSDQSAGQSGCKQQPFSDAILMCSKCCRKLAAGKTLRKAVKAAIRIAYADAVQLERVDCFSLCPKGGQVLATGAVQSRRLVIVQPTSNIAMAVEYLLRSPD